MKNLSWITLDTYKTWSLEVHENMWKYRVKQDGKIFRQFVSADGKKNKENAMHYFYKTVKALF